MEMRGDQRSKTLPLDKLSIIFVHSIVDIANAPYRCGFFDFDFDRPPQYNELESVSTLESEWLVHSSSVVATIIVGDMNVHHKTWLRYLNGISPEGKALYAFCSRLGFSEKMVS